MKTIHAPAVLALVCGLLVSCHQAQAEIDAASAALIREIKLPPLAPKPGYIIGRAVFEDGHPIPQFHVHAAGVNGNADPGLPGQVRDTYADTNGSNGQYAMPVKAGATMFGVVGQVTFMVHDVEFKLDLWPTDNLPDAADTGGFRGQTTKGIVRDFVLKMDGLRPGYAAAQHPDHTVDRDISGLGYYFGGSLNFDCVYGSTAADLLGGLKTSLVNAFPKGSTITVTLTPNGPRVDGLPGRTITRSSLLPHGEFHLYGIPYGACTATAQLAEPNGNVHNLRLSAKRPTSVADWQSSAPIDPEKFKSRYSLIPIRLYLAQ